jgi:hypothetical protein
MVINNGLNKIELTEGGDAKVSRASADYVRPTWDSIGSRVIGRHLFDMTIWKKALDETRARNSRMWSRRPLPETLVSPDIDRFRFQDSSAISIESAGYAGRSLRKVTSLV